MPFFAKSYLRRLGFGFAWSSTVINPLRAYGDVGPFGQGVCRNGKLMGL